MVETIIFTIECNETVRNRSTQITGQRLYQCSSKRTQNCANCITYKVKCIIRAEERF